MNDVVIRYAELQTLITRLNEIVSELRDAKDVREDLNDAIGKPWSRTELPDKVEDSEVRWNSKRSDLADDLQKISEHATSIYDSYKKYDADAASMFENGKDA